MAEIRVAAVSDALQRAIEQSQPGDKLIVPRDAIYYPIVLPGRHLDIIIEHEDYTSRIAGGGRMTAKIMAPQVMSDSLSARPLEGRPGTSKIEFRGIRFVNSRRDTVPVASPIAEFGRDDHYQPPADASGLPSDIIFIHCDFISQAEKSSAGIIGNVVNLIVDKCRILNIVHGKQDVQGINVYQTPGPVVIRNCEIVGSGENFLAGGASPEFPVINLDAGLVFTNNLCHKPGEWRERADIGVKNLFELKNCRRAIVTRNLFRNNWFSSQNGSAILFTPREQNPIMYGGGKTSRPNPLTGLGYIDFSQNYITNVDSAFFIISDDDISIKQDCDRLLSLARQDERNLSSSDKAELDRLLKECGQGTQGIGTINIRDNVVSNIGHYGGPGRTFNIVGTSSARPAQALHITGNVFEYSPNSGPGTLIFAEGDAPFAREFTFYRNRYHRRTYGLFESGDKHRGEAFLNRWFHEWQWGNNMCLDGEDLIVDDPYRPPSDDL